MRKTTYVLGAAAILLTLVGAGCPAKQKLEVRTEAEVETGAETKMPVLGGSVDASVDAILKSGDEEQMEQGKVESEADEVGADKTELNAYSESNYEVK